MQYLQPDTILQGGKYRVVSLLGQGGFGITYLAEQSLLKKMVAIKEFFIRDLCVRINTQYVRAIKQEDMVRRYRQKFFKEAQILACFKHPGIVKVTDIFEENDTIYYVMDYVQGESLAEIIRRRGPLPEPKAIYYISKVADAINYIHQSNVNHLDIKPDNIMIRHDDNEPIIIDFGVSKQYDENNDQMTTTPPGISNGYSPIEQYKPGGVSTFSPQADIYALGATLYKLLSGITPPNASDILNDGIPSIPLTISLPVRKAIDKAMQPRRDERPKSVREWMHMLSSNDTEESKTLRPNVYNENTNSLVDIEEEVDVFQMEKKKRRAFIWLLFPLAIIFVGGICYLILPKSSQNDNKKFPIVIDNSLTNTSSMEINSISSKDAIEELPRNTVVDHPTKIDDNINTTDASIIENSNVESVVKTHMDQLHLKGSFYNQKHSWPVEFEIKIDDDGLISGVYKNISQNVNLKVIGHLYLDGHMEIFDLNRILAVYLNKTKPKEYKGQATSGQTTLQVVLITL
jgi:serine/threonine protein kinase